MKTPLRTLIGLLTAANILSCAHAAQDATLKLPMGPLRVCAANPRYFADPTGRPVYLTGSHTWQSLQDGILSNYTAVTQPFDYPGYLTLLQTNHHNFIRLWRWELTTHEPQPWQRIGPGPALDGQPKFDLRQFNQGPSTTSTTSSTKSATKVGVTPASGNMKWCASSRALRRRCPGNIQWG